jgi:uncharacterized cofD-like protein
MSALDPRRELGRWQVENGTWLLSDPPDVSPWDEIKIVALGGGEGLARVLRGFRRLLYPLGGGWDRAADPRRLSAIVAMAGDPEVAGESRDQRALPLEDLGSCLLALADDDGVTSRLFDYRCGPGEGFDGERLGSVILAVLARITARLDHAVDWAGRLLDSRGRVYPSTLEDVVLRARFVDGSEAVGARRIAAARRGIERLTLEPAAAPALPEALHALETADLIVIGPGSLYTSLIAALLVREIAGVVARSTARVVLVANLMTQADQTDGYTAADHLDAILRHAPIRIHDVVVNTEPIPEEVRRRHAPPGTSVVLPALDAIRARGARPVGRPLLDATSGIRHDPDALARCLLELGPLEVQAGRR